MKRGAVRPGGRDLDLPGVLFVLGKGGVGKSAISDGLAALAAQRGHHALLVRIAESLHESPRSPSPSSSRHGFDVVDLDPLAAMDEYVARVVRVRALVERITGSEIYRKFFAAAPGLPELVLLGRIRAYALEGHRKRGRRWQSVIVDCPSSGHGLLMLETPFAAFRAVSAGPFARLASQIIEWLRTDARVALVAIPEEMAVIEAIEFKEDLWERTGLAPTLAFLNRMRGEALSSAARRALKEVEAAPGSKDRVLLDCALRVLRKGRREAFHLRRLTRGLGLTPVIVPELPNCRPATVAGALSGEGP